MPLKLVNGSRWVQMDDYNVVQAESEREYDYDPMGTLRTSFKKRSKEVFGFFCLQFFFLFWFGDPLGLCLSASHSQRADRREQKLGSQNEGKDKGGKGEGVGGQNWAKRNKNRRWVS